MSGDREAIRAAVFVIVLGVATLCWMTWTVVRAVDAVRASRSAREREAQDE